MARLLTDGLAYARRWRGNWRVPTTAAITRARARLGPEPLRALFAEVCQPVATEAGSGSFYRAWRLVAVDGTTFDLPDNALPGQVLFSGDGRHLAGTRVGPSGGLSYIDSFVVGADGRLTAAPGSPFAASVRDHSIRRHPPAGAKP